MQGLQSLILTSQVHHTYFKLYPLSSTTLIPVLNAPPHSSVLSCSRTVPEFHHSASYTHSQIGSASLTRLGPGDSPRQHQQHQTPNTNVSSPLTRTVSLPLSPTHHGSPPVSPFASGLHAAAPEFRVMVNPAAQQRLRLDGSLHDEATDVVVRAVALPGGEDISFLGELIRALDVSPAAELPKAS